MTVCHRTRGIRALLLQLACACLALAPEAAFGSAVPGWVLALPLAAVLAGAAAAHRPGRVVPRLVASLALGVAVGAFLFEHASQPLLGLATLGASVGFGSYLWPSEALRLRAADQGLGFGEQDVLVGALLAALCATHLAWGASAPGVLRQVALAAVCVLPSALALQRAAEGAPRALVGAAMGLASAPLLGALVRQAARADAGIALIACLVVLGWSGQRAQRWSSRGARPTAGGPLATLIEHPSRVLVLSFVGICLVGTLLLALPVAANGAALSWLDACFTAVSATCVTGLIVVDTPVAFSPTGQLFVLLLIQVGGLGIMVFSTAAFLLLGKRLSLAHERAAVDLVGASGPAGLVRAIRAVLLVTFTTEAVAALLLTGAFLAAGDGLGEAAWRGLFTAVSAFCNAGFALQSDSLVPYADGPFVLGVVGVTIVVGGLGPAVIAALAAWRDPTRRTLHVRLVVVTTAVLLVVPAVLILVLEWEASLAGLSVFDKLCNAAFQSVTLRTAGFNSVDLTALHPVTWTVMVATMFVGGSPGSTAGGIKTTTCAVVFLAIAAIVRGREQVVVFGRTLPKAAVLRATAVVTLGAVACVAGLVAVQLTQTLALDVAFFEVVSALATVGLSTGGTGALDGVGKVIIIACMFAGRVGPLSLFMFIGTHAQDARTVAYPREPVPIG